MLSESTPYCSGADGIAFCVPSGSASTVQSIQEGDRLGALIGGTIVVSGAIVGRELTIQILQRAALRTINKEGLTAAGRALTKHAQGKRASGSFPPLKGGIKRINDTAEQIVKDILRDPNSSFKKIGRGGLTVRSPNSQGHASTKMVVFQVS